LIQGIETLKNGISALGIDANRWFIQDKHFRLMKKPQSDVEPSLHPIGKSSDRLVGTIVQPNDFQDTGNPFFQTLSL